MTPRYTKQQHRIHAMSIGTYIIVSLVKIVLAVFVLLTAVAYTTLAERKVVAHIQNR